MNNNRFKDNPKRVCLTLVRTFSAGHTLYDNSLNAEDNYKLFGKCSNPSGHGHNYKVAITVCGIPDSRTGMIINLSELKDIIDQNIIKYVDHKNLNIDVDFLKGINPTAENLVIKFWQILEKALPEGMLYEIVLYESEKQWVSYRG